MPSCWESLRNSLVKASKEGTATSAVCSLGKKEGDLKEFWHFGQEPDEDAKLTEEYPKNVKVEELKDFNHTGMEAYRMLEKTGIYVLRALALYIGLEEHYFDHWASNGNSILRPIHYPPITEEPEGAVRAGAHGDINLISLLMGSISRFSLLLLSRYKRENLSVLYPPIKLRAL